MPLTVGHTRSREEKYAYVKGLITLLEMNEIVVAIIGLDSQSSFNIVRFVKKLAASGQFIHLHDLSTHEQRHHLAVVGEQIFELQSPLTTHNTLSETILLSCLRNAGIPSLEILRMRPPKLSHRLPKSQLQQYTIPKPIISTPQMLVLS